MSDKNATPPATDQAAPPATDQAAPRATDQAAPRATDQAAPRATETPAPRATETPAPRPCPICGKPATQTAKPFCSKRCADVDLHRWLGGVYALPARAGETDEEPSDDGSP